MATGWLGWAPDIAMTTPIGQITLAIEGRVDFVRKTNPFGSGEKTDEEKLAEQVDAPELAAQQLVGFVKRRQAQDNRQVKKKSR